MTGGKGRLVYVLDDDEAVRDSLCFLLTSHGIACEAFGSPPEFLGGFDPARAGCLVLDLHMPWLSGLEVLEKLRSRGVTMPVIVVSGRRNSASDAALLEAGALIVLNKPVDVGELLALIRAAMDAVP